MSGGEYLAGFHHSVVGKSTGSGSTLELAVKVYDLDGRQAAAAVSFAQCHQSEFAGGCLVICFHRRRGAAQQCFSTVHGRKHYGGITAVVSRRRVGLFVACFVLFVDNHQAQAGKRQEYRRARSYNHTWLVAAQQFLPYFHTLGIGELGVVYKHPCAENALQTFGQLCGKGYFRHKQQSLVAVAQYMVDEMDV